MHLTRQKPRGFLKWSLRAPIWLYRLHLGWVLGERFLLLEHTGRKTGKLRATVIEVVAHDLKSDTYFVTAGWAEQSDWLKNIMHQPNVQLQVGTRHLAVHAERLKRPEAAQVLLSYAQQHPRAFKELPRVMLGKALTATLQDCTALAERVPVIAFRPRAASRA